MNVYNIKYHVFAKMILKKEIKLKIKYKYFIPFVLKLVIKRKKITYKFNILILEYIFTFNNLLIFYLFIPYKFKLK